MSYKKLFIISPIIVLIIMLWLINHTINYFVDTEYKIMFDSNVKTIKRFTEEIENYSLSSDSNNHTEFYKSMIDVCFTTLSSKDAVIAYMFEGQAGTAILDIDDHEYIWEMLNLNQITLQNYGYFQNNSGNQYYYQKISDGENDYYIFMTVDHEYIWEMLNLNQIIVPISIIGILLLISVQDSIWLRVVRQRGQK